MNELRKRGDGTQTIMTNSTLEIIERSPYVR